jgi:TolB-like protein
MVSLIPAALSLDQTREDPRPSVAVMPFATMSDGGDQPYFADGLTEDVTTATERISSFQADGVDLAVGYGRPPFRLGLATELLF